VNAIIAGGGTAGHVNPALALAEKLHADEVGFIGTATGVEASLVPPTGHSFQPIEIEGFDRSRPLRLPLVGIRAAGAIVAARRLLKARRPDVVVGMGGYVSLPVCLAAATVRIPVVLHEQNIVLGLAHRTCKPVAARIAVSFEDTLTQTGAKGVMTGNPVGKKVAELDVATTRPLGLQRFGLAADRRTVLVFGGSLGARTINRAGIDLASRWAGRDDVQILHITGRSPSTQVAVPADADEAVYRSLPYTDAIEEAYAVADVAVCRGGASTIAELTAVGIPAVVVPYPFHRDRQQYLHGYVLEKAGAGVVIEDHNASAATLEVALTPLLDPAGLDRARTAARSLGRPDAAELLAEVVRSAA
jgi:UDP-N-acetylglucosamine--N-acetylmuramyl-(pentapeptide) pyrophosphoryl-undecaprenol N-acetylglucosamine transferase